MEYQVRRPFSAKSRLESAQPLTSTSPVNRAPARSNSQSAAGSIAQYNTNRARALGDSARAHGSPSKTRSRNQLEDRPDIPTRPGLSAPASTGCSSFVKLFLVVLLFCWQGLVFLVLLLTLHTTRDINQQIGTTGLFLADMH